MTSSQEAQASSHAGDRRRKIYRVTLAGSVCNMALMAFKFAAGVLGHSSAMMADAVHSLSDLVTDVVVLVFVRLSGKPQDSGHDYGHGKFETLATAFVGVFLFVAGAGILWDGAVSVFRCLQGEQLGEPGWVALVAALVSIGVKEWLFWHTVWVGRRVGSPTVVANAWHHRSDAFSSVGTAVGIGGAILLGPEWRVLDPLAAVVVSLLVMRAAVGILRGSMDELLEASLPDEAEARIRDIILSFPEASEPHHLRTRRIGARVAIEAHVRMDGGMSLREAHEVTTRIESALKSEFGPDTFISLHAEPIKEG